jgi:hypothetical protein
MQMHKRTIQMPMPSEQTACEAAVVIALEALFSGIWVLPDVFQNGDK